MANQDGKRERVWGALMAVCEVHMTPHRMKGPQANVLLRDGSGTRQAVAWNLPPAQLQLLADATTQATPVLRVSGTVEKAGQRPGVLTIHGVSAAEPGAEYSVEGAFLQAAPQEATTILKNERVVSDNPGQEARFEVGNTEEMVSHKDRGLKDNFRNGSVGEFLQSSLPPGAMLSFVTAYFSIYAYDKLKAELNGARETRLLFGDPQFLKSLDPKRDKSKQFVTDRGGLSLDNVLSQKSIARECQRWIDQKVQVKSLKRENLLHGKMYLVRGPQDGQMTLDAYDLPPQVGLLGSSNFTVTGLGLASSGNNIELNLVVRDPEDFGALQAWFEDVWTDKELVKDVKDEVLLYLEQLYINKDPEFIYYKTLFHVFEKFLADAERGGFLDDTMRLQDTAVWKSLFAFQKDGVKGIINKINRHGGCILADSVGLGKTYEALAVIKYFEMKNSRVLVLCPKKLRENWTLYLDAANSTLNPLREDRFRYTVLSHTDLSRPTGRVGDVDLATHFWEGYDLVVVDESHNFRTESRRMEGPKSRYQKLFEDVIQAGTRTNVLLLSATPVNNDLKDLRAQVRLITSGEDNALREAGIPNVKTTLDEAQRRFKDWAEKRKNDKSLTAAKLLADLPAPFFTLLDEVTIARSRKQISTHYADAMAQIGRFPRREKPVSLFPAVDTEGGFPAYDIINARMQKYSLALFRPTQFVLEKYRPDYSDRLVANFSQEKRETFLVGMMKVNYLKRLESSVHSFAATMRRTLDKIVALENRLRGFLALQAMETPQQAAHETVDAAAEARGVLDANEDEEAESLIIGALQIPLSHMDIPRWLKELEKDRQQLQSLYDSALAVSADRDAKLQELKQIVREKATQANKKIIVFTAFADTAAYLYEALHLWAKAEFGLESALVVGSGENRATWGDNRFQEILTHFSPISKGRDRVPNLPKDREIDLLIATDCISEGQNLQDADMVVNYDIHWNPVRLIQRFGRIDRLGSRNDAIRMVNFWPTADLNQYIDLKSRVEARMALVDVSATGGDDLLKPHDIEELTESDLSYRDKQLLRLKDEVLDLEEMNEDAVTLSEFTLDDFRADLARFLNENEGKLRDAPFGLYACVPTTPARPASYGGITPPQAQPGVIFCLRQKDAEDAKSVESVNPLTPHFLVYIRDDGEVRYNFVQAKQVLNLFRALCLGATQAYETLCDAFDAETQDGKDMTRYSDLLKKAVRRIQMQFGEKDNKSLGRRGGLLTKMQDRIGSPDDFELVTWLVIR